MTTKRKKYDPEFKIKAVKMVLEDGLTKAEVSRKLDINQSLISNWVKAYLADSNESFPGNGNLKPADEEMRKLRKKVKDQEDEIKFLKKSAAYFASLKK